MSRGIDGIIECVDVSKAYIQGDVTLDVLRNVSATFCVSSSYALTGVSGSGKSTLLHLLSGLERPTHGTVLINGANSAHFRPKQLQLFLSKTVGLMFQAHYLINELSVIENIMLAGMIRGERTDACKQRAGHLIDLVGLGAHAAASPALLSGGQQQRVALARALFNKPTFLLADEPTGSLDAENAATMVDLMFAAQKEWGMGIIVCTHDMAVAHRMAVEYRVGNGEVKLMREL